MRQRIYRLSLIEMEATRARGVLDLGMPDDFRLVRQWIEPRDAWNGHGSYCFQVECNRFPDLPEPEIIRLTGQESWDASTGVDRFNRLMGVPIPKD